MKRSAFWMVLLIFPAILVTVSFTTTAWAQGEQALYAFKGGPNDGANPFGRPLFDSAGNLYGTTLAGGNTYWAGSVYQLTPSGGGWAETMIYSFSGSTDGAQPEAGLIMDNAGNLYGTTSGGGLYNKGTVFELTPSGGGWTQQVLHSFTGGIDGATPYLGQLTFDKAGNLWGTTNSGGQYNAGTVFKLIRTKSGWREKVIYAFAGGNDAKWPNESLVFDSKGKALYGASYQGGGSGCGGYGCGTVFALTKTSTGWQEQVLYAFTGGPDGAQPYESVILDQAGNLYGTTFSGGDTQGHGVVFELVRSQNTWTEKVLYTFKGRNDGANPYVNVIFGKDGVLYGATDQAGAHKNGVLFKLTPMRSGKWRQDVLYAFTGGTDGGLPLSGLTFDNAGNIYGVTVQGGDDNVCSFGCGAVYEYAP